MKILVLSGDAPPKISHLANIHGVLLRVPLGTGFLRQFLQLKPQKLAKNSEYFGLSSRCVGNQSKIFHMMSHGMQMKISLLLISAALGHGDSWALFVAL